MNLSTQYLGMKLRTPLVPSASPLSDNLDNVKRMEDAGAAAVVFHSLFEEHIQNERQEPSPPRTHGTESHAEALTSEILTSFRINLSLFGEKSGGDLWSGKGSLTLSKTGTDVRRHGLARGCPGGGSRP